MAQDICLSWWMFHKLLKKLGIVLLLDGMRLHISEILIVYFVVQIVYIFADILFTSFISC